MKSFPFFALLLLFKTSDARGGRGQEDGLEEFSKCLKNYNVPGGVLVLKETNPTLFNTLNFQWNTISDITPLAYLQPNNVYQVQKSVLCSKTTDVRIVPKSGGHSYPKFSFGDNSTIIIDFNKMHSIEVNRVAKVSTVQPGALMVHYQLALEQHQFVSPATVCYTVGLGGAVQGGGYGYLSKKLGLLVDNVIEFDIVTANGELITAKEHENADLFWALRGGAGGNFGIVTQIRLQIYDASSWKFSYNILVYPLSSFEAVFAAFQKLCALYKDKTAFLAIRVMSDGVVVRVVDTNLSQRELNKILEIFPAPASQQLQNFDTYFPIVQQSPAGLIPVEVLRNYTRPDEAQSSVKTKTYFSKKTLSSQEIGQLNEVYQRIPLIFELYFTSWGGAINDVPKSATAFVHRDALYIVELKVETYGPVELQWVNDFEQVAKLFDNGESYQNIQDPDLTNYLDRYYGSNLNKLKRVKAKYDPDNVFYYPQSIPAS